MALAVLYDIHGNLPALEAVLAEARAAGADRWLLGGDYLAPEPLGSQTLALLRTLDPAVWLRGNGERWLAEPSHRPEVIAPLERIAREVGPTEVARLHALPAAAELDGLLFVHGSPLADDRSFRPEPDPTDGVLLDGVRDRTVVFGHTHRQFRRPGANRTLLVNPGSVGQPLDGDARAGWALWDGDWDLRRTAYDVGRAAAAYRRGGAAGDYFARRVELASP